MRPIHPGFGFLGDEGAALNPKKRLQTSPNSSIFQLKTMKNLQYKYILKHFLTILPVLLNPNHFLGQNRVYDNISNSEIIFFK